MEHVRLGSHDLHANDNRQVPAGIERLRAPLAPATGEDCFGQTYVETEVAWDATLLCEHRDDPYPFRLVDGTW